MHSWVWKTKSHYSSDPMHDAYYIVENNKEFLKLLLLLYILEVTVIIYNQRSCCHNAEDKWPKY